MSTASTASGSDERGDVGPGRAGDPAGWSLRRRVGRAIGGVVGLLVVLLLLIVLALYGTKETGDRVVERWDPATLAAQNALSAMVNQETGVRGFVLSADELSLEPYERYQDDEREAVADLRRLVDGEDEMSELLDELEATAAEWRATVATPVIAQVRAGDPAAGRFLGSTEARAAFDRIRDAADDLARAIAAERAENIDDREGAFNLLWITIAGAAVVLGAATVLLRRGLRRSVLAPVEGLAEQTRLVAGGDLDRHIDQEGPDEIRALAHDVDVMRARLAAELARVQRARVRLERRGAELARSNADLEQFAYVASHDLSEPLRKVTNFCQLLERQYADQLDDKARRYIGFMVDGAKRMQILINDLLAFSRVGRTTEGFVPVDLDKALTHALSNLEGPLAESGARVVRGPLPTVPGDTTLLTALLQNLVGNAVKYRDPERPQLVTVSAQQAGDVWRITVDDEGIGIDPEYAERIFVIFQRLHLRDEYGGTGIGLALCRKIVDFHGGRIWLAEKAEPGATFHFTLPLTHTPTGEVDDDEPAPLAAT